MLAQQAAPYMAELPPDIQLMVNPPPSDGSNITSFANLYANDRGLPTATMQYGFSIALLPIAFFVLGILTLFCFNCYICSRCCFKCSRCEVKASKRTKSDTSPMAIAADTAIQKAELYGKTDEKALRMKDKAESIRVHESITKQRKRITGIFVILALLPFITGIGLTFISNTYFDDAHAQYGVQLSIVDERVTIWKNGNTNLEQSLAQLDYDLGRAQLECDAIALDSMQTNMDELTDAIPSLEELVSSLQDLVITSEIDYLATYLGDYRTYSTYTFAAIPFISFILMIFMVISGPNNKHCLNRSAMCCGQCVILLYSIIGLPLLLITIILSDLCISESPPELMMNLVPKEMTSGENANNTAIFLSCTNPLTSVMTLAQDGMKDMHDALEDILQSPAVALQTCPTSHHVSLMNATVVDIYKEPNGILTTYVPDTECPTFKPLLYDIIESNICSSTYNAIFALTASICAASILTFICIVFLPPLKSHYNYLLKIWEEEEENDDDDDDDDSDLDEFLDPDDIKDKPGSDSKDDVVALYEETKEEEDAMSKVSKVTEFDWSVLDNMDGGLDKINEEDPHYNPNAKPSSTTTNTNNTYNDMDFDLESVGAKTVEDIVHYEAINDAGYEDEL